METLQRTANRGSVSTGYDVANSLKVESDNNEYLERSTSGASDGSSTQHTISVWVKRTELGVDSEPVSAGGIGRFRFESNDTFSYQFRSGKELITTQVFRDTSAWYHIVAAADSSQSTASNRMKVYVNGVQVTDFGTANYQDQNQGSPAWGKNTTYSLRVGAAASSTRNFNGYIAEMYYIDGQTLDPTSFGEFDDNGIWIPKAFSGTHGSLDTYLDFSDASNLGKNSGGTTDLTANNISAADQATDTCTNNFCTPLIIQSYANTTDIITHTEGGTKLTTGAGTGWRTNMSTISLSSGKWYFEAKHPGTIDGDAIMTGIVPTARFTNSASPNFYSGQSSGDGIGWYWDSRRFRYDDGSTISPPQNTVNSGDILGIALDMDNNYVYSRINGGAWHNNGSADGDPTSGSSGTGGFAVADEPHMICTSMYHPNKNFFVNYGGYNAFPVSSAASDANGHGVFEYAPPSGYFAICTKNLAEFG